MFVLKLKSSFHFSSCIKSNQKINTLIRAEMLKDIEEWKIILKELVTCHFNYFLTYSIVIDY